MSGLLISSPNGLGPPELMFLSLAVTEIRAQVSLGLENDWARAFRVTFLSSMSQKLGSGLRALA